MNRLDTLAKLLRRDFDLLQSFYIHSCVCVFPPLGTNINTLYNWQDALCYKYIHRAGWKI